MKDFDSRVLFLDIDGVLNSRKFFLERGYSDGRNLTDEAQFDARAIDLLNGVIDRTGALVVISSSWRLIHTTGSIWRMLRSKGFTGRVIDKTPGGCDAFNAYGVRGRSKEIRLWLEENEGMGIRSFAVIDDDYDAGVGYAPRFVQTTFEDGLLPTHCEALVRILERDLDEES